MFKFVNAIKAIFGVKPEGPAGDASQSAKAGDAVELPDFIDGLARSTWKEFCQYGDFTIVCHLNEKGNKTYTIYQGSEPVAVKKDALKEVNRLAGLGLSEEEKMTTNAWASKIVQALRDK